MKILLVTVAYPPEIRMISAMCQELAQELTSRGHCVTVITSWPQYNLDEESANRSYSEYTVEDGVNVIRVRAIPHHKVNMIIRGIAELSLPFLYLRKIKKYVNQKIDAVIAYSPPLPLAFVGTRLKKKHRARYLLNIQDIFPQNAIDLGIIKNSFVASFYEFLEMKAYQGADKLTSHTSGGRSFLINNKNIISDRIFTVPNWIDVSSYKNGEATEIFRKKYDLKDKFIFLFAGILGPAQNLEFVIEVARRVVDLTNVRFLFVGDGTEKQKLKDLVAKHNISNVIFESFVSMDLYPNLVREADVGLVCLSSTNRTFVVPGKVLGFMAAAIPIVAFLNKESDTHTLINEAKCGYSVVSDDPQMAVDIVRKIYLNRLQLKKYGESGHKYVVANYSQKTCIDQLEKLIM